MKESKIENRVFLLGTLESGIVELVGISVLVETFVKINKYAGGNKRTGGNFCQIKCRNKPFKDGRHTSRFFVCPALSSYKGI